MRRRLKVCAVLWAMGLGAVLAACQSAGVTGTPTATEDTLATGRAEALGTLLAMATETAAALPRTPTSTPTDTIGVPSEPGLPTLIPFPTPTPQPLVADGGALPERALARIGSGYLSQLALSPDGESLAMATASGIYVYRVEGFERIWRRYLLRAPTTIAWSPSGNQLVTGFGINDPPILWDAVSGQRIRALGGWFEGIWSPTGSMFAVEETPYLVQIEGTSDYNLETNKVILYDGQTGQFLKTLDTGVAGFYGKVFDSIVWSPDERYLAASMRGDPGIYVWDVRSGQLLHTIDASSWVDEYSKQIVFSPDSSLIGVMGEYGTSTIPFWAVDTADLRMELEQGENIWELAWSPDGRRLATVSSHWVIVRDSVSWAPIYEVSPPTPTQRIVWSPDGTRLALMAVHTWQSPNSRSGVDQTYATTVEILDTDNGTVTSELGMAGHLTQFIWLPDSRRAITANRDVVLWDTEVGQPLAGISTSLNVQRAAWTPEGRTLVLETTEGFLYWDGPTNVISVTPPDDIGDPALLFNTKTADCSKNLGVGPEIWSPDGIWHVTGTGNGGCGDGPWGGGCGYERGSIILEDEKTGSAHSEKDFEGAGVTSLAWSPDETMLAVGLGNGFTNINDIIVINPYTWEELFVLTGHSAAPIWLAFTRSGDRLASVSDDGTVIVWALTD